MSTAVSASYLSLIRQFPLRPLRTVRDYERAAAMIDRLAVREEPDLEEGERDYLQTLEMLVEAYDQLHFDLGPDRRAPHQRLRHLMEQVGMTPRDLVRVLGVSQSLVSLILNGKRNLSRANVRKLAEHFRVDASYFL